MLDPAALAETVTPPIFSPTAEVTVPESSASAACAETAAPNAITPDAIIVAIGFARVRLRALSMASLLIVGPRRALRVGRGGTPRGPPAEREGGRGGGGLGFGGGVISDPA